MIGVSVVLIGAVLLSLLLFLWMRANWTSQSASSPWEPSLSETGTGQEVCSPEYVTQIFSADDLEFVSRMGLPPLQRIFRRERNSVAHFWVQQCSAQISRIMRQHLETSRQSHDLEFTTEAGIFLKYAELKLVCGLLFASIELMGPQKVRSLAIYASNLAQSIGEAQRAITSVTQTREVGGAGSH